MLGVQTKFEIKMKKGIFLFVLAISLIACQSRPTAENAGAGEAQDVAVASGVEYSVDSSSTLGWKGSKPGGEHHGVVSIKSGTVEVKAGKIVSGSFEIDLNTITDLDISDAGMNAKLVGHLKSPDFFDVAQFPTAKFDLVSLDALPEAAATEGDALKANYSVTGNLTIKGITKSISFPAQIVISDGSIEVMADDFSIDRTQWGVNYGSKSIFAELKDKFINDMMVINLNLVFNKV